MPVGEILNVHVSEVGDEDGVPAVKYHFSPAVMVLFVLKVFIFCVVEIFNEVR